MAAKSPGLDIVGLCGSLRAASFNAMALRLAGRSMPPGMTLETVDWAEVPPFNADALASGLPCTVTALRDRIRRADGVLIATPEYNFSIPGMLKNLIDWLSRGDDQPLARKPIAILSAVTGSLGGARVQYDLRRVLLFVDAMPLMKPEVFIGQAQSKFGPEGECKDEATRDFVAAQMLAFGRWIRQVESRRCWEQAETFARSCVPTSFHLVDLGADGQRDAEAGSRVRLVKFGEIATGATSSLPPPRSNASLVAIRGCRWRAPCRESGLRSQVRAGSRSTGQGAATAAGRCRCVRAKRGK